MKVSGAEFTAVGGGHERRAPTARVVTLAGAFNLDNVRAHVRENLA